METYQWKNGFGGNGGSLMTATVKRDGDITWIRITRRLPNGAECFVSHYGYRGKYARKEIAKLQRKGVK